MTSPSMTPQRVRLSFLPPAAWLIEDTSSGEETIRFMESEDKDTNLNRAQTWLDNNGYVPASEEDRPAWQSEYVLK